MVNIDQGNRLKSIKTESNSNSNLESCLRRVILLPLQPEEVSEQSCHSCCREEVSAQTGCPRKRRRITLRRHCVGRRRRAVTLSR